MKLWGLDTVGDATVGDKKGRILLPFLTRLVELVKNGNNTPLGLMAVVRETFQLLLKFGRGYLCRVG